jgi:hypothetical protein
VTYTSREQYERNHLRICARCGRWAAKAANWSDGPICRTCLDRALRIRGQCPDCGTKRLLPGRGQDGTPICRDCAGITRSFFCNRCGFEGRLHTGRLCERCTFTDKVTAALDDGTGQISPALKPLADHLIAMHDPWKGWMWIRQPWVQDLLAGPATSRVLLTHEALHALPNWRTVAYVRDLLMASGVLPAVDKQLLHFETWLTHRRLELIRRAATDDQIPLPVGSPPALCSSTPSRSAGSCACPSTTFSTRTTGSSFASVIRPHPCPNRSPPC